MFSFKFFSRVTNLSHSYDHDIPNLQTQAQPQNIEFLQRLFSGKLRSFNKKTGLVDSTGFTTIVVKMKRFVSFVSKPCLLVPFQLTMLNKHLLKQDLEPGKRR